MTFKIEVTTTDNRLYVESIRAATADRALHDAARLIGRRENISVLCARDVGAGKDVSFFS